MTYLAYDCEIENCIPNRGEPIEEGLNYCQGWGDHAGMGISVITVYTAPDDRYRVYCKDNLEEFAKLVAWAEEQRLEIVGFNSIGFDDKLCAANGINIRTTYDLLCEVRIASGQPPYYVKGKTRAGYNLDAIAKATFGRGKTGSGALAPVMWQRGQIGAVINYGLYDIQLTKRLFDNRHQLIDPTTGELLVLPASKRELVHG